MHHLFGAFLPHRDAKRCIDTYCLVLTSCLLAYGCSTAKDLGKKLGDLAVIRAELMKKYGEADVNLRINTFQCKSNVCLIT